MENYVLLKKSTELENLKLGFTKTYFADDLLVLVSGTKKEVLKKTKDAKKESKLVIFRPSTEEMLRFALEKTNIDLILGSELINPKDSVHFARSGLDQITCKIAAQKNKIIGFSFDDVLKSKNKSQLIARISLNLRLCKKYKVKTKFFSDIHSQQDLAAFSRVLQKQRNIYK